MRDTLGVRNTLGEATDTKEHTKDKDKSSRLRAALGRALAKPTDPDLKAWLAAFIADADDEKGGTSGATERPIG